MSGQWSVVGLGDYGQEVTSLLLTADITSHSLFDFFVSRMFVAVRAELSQF